MKPEASKTKKKKCGRASRMNKRYEEGRKPLFSEAGEKQRKQYVWAKDKKGEEYLQETEPIDIQQEIESYADECDIKSIVRKASFDPQFLKSLSEGAMTGAEVDITEFPQNIHEYHRMMATAQAKMTEIQQNAQKQEESGREAPAQNNEGGAATE
nr:MAG TPA: Scaffold protein [Microviridae sp.]